MAQEGLAARARMFRAKADLTIGQAAKGIGVEYHTLSAIERGKRNPQIATLKKMARFYGVGVEELVSVEDEAPTGKGEASAKPEPHVVEMVWNEPDRARFGEPTITVSERKLDRIMHLVEEGSLSAEEGKLALTGAGS